MKRITALTLILVLLLPACALALNGQSYDTFAAYYQEDVTFINDNDSRHLLPLVLSQRSGGAGDSHTYYDLYGDVLTVNLAVDITGVIETCDIQLTAPPSMAYGDTAYNDFAISGYHSYAFLMAMDADRDPAARYALVTDVVRGMRENNGGYIRTVGDYTLTCTRNGNTAILNFSNDGLTGETQDPSVTPSPVPDDDNDETGGYIG
ncbi:MAG: hypothetical protein PHY64_06675 [Eubacteriales bacterium]|nr:hypothetical protein [Eubacteriales bacterium]